MNELIAAFLRWLGQIIYTLLDLSQEEWFQWVSFIWLIVGILYDLSQNQSFLRGLHTLIAYPLIDHYCRQATETAGSGNLANASGTLSATSTNSQRLPNLPLYPRQFLEELSCRLIDALTFPVRRWIYPALSRIAYIIYPWREYNIQSTFLSLIFAVFLLFFAYGDTIAIANALDALGLVQGGLPEALLYYERAVAAASFFAIIVGFFVLLETFVYVSAANQTQAVSSDARGGEEEEGVERITERQPVFVDVRSPEMARLMQGLSLTIIFIGIIVSVLLGIGRLMALGFWENNSGLTLIVQFGVNVLTLVNGILAAALVFLDGIRGLRVMIAVAVWLLIGVLLIIDFIGFVGVRIFTFTLDYIWRLALLIIYIGIVVIFRPPQFLIDKFLVSPIKGIGRYFSRS